MTSPAFPPAGGRRLFFLHLPKTEARRCTTISPRPSRRRRSAPAVARLHTLPPEALARYRYFSGHFNYEHLLVVPGPCYVVTVLRDPVGAHPVHLLLLEAPPAGGCRPPQPGRPGGGARTDLLGFLRSPSHIVRDAIDNTMARYLAGGADINDGLGYVFSNAGSMVRITEMEIVHCATGNLMAVDLFGFTSPLNRAHAKVSLDFGMPRLCSGWNG